MIKISMCHYCGEEVPMPWLDGRKKYCGRPCTQKAYKYRLIHGYDTRKFDRRAPSERDKDYGK